MVCKNQACLNKVKRAVDTVAALPQLESFSRYFSDTVLEQIDDLINVEKNNPKPVNFWLAGFL